MSYFFKMVPRNISQMTQSMLNRIIGQINVESNRNTKYLRAQEEKKYACAISMQRQIKL